MSSFAYVAVDPRGMEMRGTLVVSDQKEALKRIKEMGLFPTKLLEAAEEKRRATKVRRPKARSPKEIARLRRGLLPFFLQGRVKAKVLTAFTRQTATLLEAGLPLLRGLRLLQEQEESPVLSEAA